MVTMVLDLRAKAGHQRLQSGAGWLGLGRPPWPRPAALALPPCGTAFPWYGPDLL